MRDTNQILRDTRNALTQNPLLWMPAFAILLLQDAILPLGVQQGRAPQLLGALAAVLAATMITAGWYAMVARVLRGGNATLRDFVDGVNARWLSIVSGSIVYWLVLAALGAIAFWYGQRTYGFETLVSWFRSLLELSPAQQQAALELSQIPPTVIGWLNLAAIWFSAVAGINALLVFWQPLVVLQGQRWTAAWIGSAGLLFRRFGQVLFIGALHIGSLLLARLLIATLNPAFMIVGVALQMLSITYFSIVYATVVEDEWPVTATQTDVRV